MKSWRDTFISSIILGAAAFTIPLTSHAQDLLLKEEWQGSNPSDAFGRQIEVVNSPNGNGKNLAVLGNKSLKFFSIESGQKLQFTIQATSGIGAYQKFSLLKSNPDSGDESFAFRTFSFKWPDKVTQNIQVRNSAGDVIFQKSLDGVPMPYSLASISDLNGDSNPEIAFAESTSSESFVKIFASTFPAGYEHFRVIRPPAGESDLMFGYNLVSLPDLDGNGAGELLITSSTKAYIYYPENEELRLLTGLSPHVNASPQVVGDYLVVPTLQELEVFKLNDPTTSAPYLTATISCSQGCRDFRVNPLNARQMFFVNAPSSNHNFLELVDLENGQVLKSFDLSWNLATHETTQSGFQVLPRMDGVSATKTDLVFVFGSSQFSTGEYSVPEGKVGFYTLKQLKESGQMAVRTKAKTVLTPATPIIAQGGITTLP